VKSICMGLVSSEFRNGIIRSIEIGRIIPARANLIVTRGGPPTVRPILMG